MAFSDAVVIWCIYAKILLDMALASSDANALQLACANPEVKAQACYVLI